MAGLDPAIHPRVKPAGDGEGGNESARVFGVLRHASRMEQVEAALAALGLRLILDVAGPA
ncbi:MAG TPA: hypothetical protein VGR91_09150 [Stellaceae bacterium]|nr:hypothetical protein [Stellaceae bacterium]